MKTISLLLTLCVTFTLTMGKAFAEWPDYRGPSQNGISTVKSAPTNWSEEQNIAWKTALPGRAWSSPVILDGQIWVSTASEDGKKLGALAVDLLTGKIIHQLHLFDVAKPVKWRYAGDMQSYGSPSPVIEAGRVYVTFGNDGTACIDTKSGKVLWQRQDINADHMEGAGSSPVLYKDLLILTMDGGDVYYNIALNKATGKTAWKTNRSINFGSTVPDRRKAFCTPIFHKGKAGMEMIIPAAQAVYGLQPETGKELWRADYNNNGFSVGCRPVLAGDSVVLSTGYTHPEMLSVKLGKHGNVTDAITWRDHRGVPAIPSPIVVNNQIYTVDEKGFITCRQPSDGKILWKGRLENKFASSPVYAAGHLYFFDQSGTAHIIKPGDSLNVVARNRLAGGFMSSPAVIEGALIVRSKTHLYRIGQ